MSIIITNITPADQTEGPDRYVLRINERVICEFDHERKLNGLAQCLMDAADAVEVVRKKEMDTLILKFASAITMRNMNK
jgi:hypothetical protein